jgi:CBS domain-containing protein
VVFVFELTGDYQVMLPLMGATVVADVVFNTLSEHSVMTEKLHRRGLRVGRHYGVDPFSTEGVRTIMSAPVTTLAAMATVADARRLLLRGGHGAYPLTDAGRMVGIVTRGDVLAAREDQEGPRARHRQPGRRLGRPR